MAAALRFAAHGTGSGSGGVRLAMSQDGARLLTAGADHQVHLYKVATLSDKKQEKMTFTDHSDRVRCAAFDPSRAGGTRFATGGEDGKVFLQQQQLGEWASRELFGIGTAVVTCVCFSPDGAWLAIASDIGLRLVSIGEGGDMQLLSDDHPCMAAVWRREGIAAVLNDGTVRLWPAVGADYAGASVAGVARPAEPPAPLHGAGARVHQQRLRDVDDGALSSAGLLCACSVRGAAAFAAPGRDAVLIHPVAGGRVAHVPLPLRAQPLLVAAHPALPVVVAADAGGLTFLRTDAPGGVAALGDRVELRLEKLTDVVFHPTAPGAVVVATANGEVHVLPSLFGDAAKQDPADKSEETPKCEGEPGSEVKPKSEEDTKSGKPADDGKEKSEEDIKSDKLTYGGEEKKDNKPGADDYTAEINLEPMPEGGGSDAAEKLRRRFIEEAEEASRDSEDDGEQESDDDDEDEGEDEPDEGASDGVADDTASRPVRIRPGRQQEPADEESEAQKPEPVAAPSWRTAQPAFQPGEVPEHGPGQVPGLIEGEHAPTAGKPNKPKAREDGTLRSRVLCWNAIGLVRVTEGAKGDANRVITATFYDASSYGREVRIKDSSNVDAPLTMAALGRTGMLLAAGAPEKKDDDAKGAKKAGEEEADAAKEEPALRIVYRPTKAWGTSPDWSYILPPGEEPVALAVGDRWAACFTNKYLRLWSQTGVDIAVLSLPHRAVCAASYDGTAQKSTDGLTYEPQDALAYVTQDAVGQCHLTVLGVTDGKVHEDAVPVALSAGATLRWIGWCGAPHDELIATQDSDGVVRVMFHRWGRQWVPVAERPEAFFVLGLRGSKLRGAEIAEGRTYPDPRTADVAQLAERELGIPVLPRGGARHTACAEQYVQRTMLAEDKKARLGIYNPDIAALEVKANKEVLYMFDFALRSVEHGSTSRALDLAFMINHKEHLEEAMKIAHNKKLQQLYHKMRLVSQAHFGENGLRKCKLPQKGQKTMEGALVDKLKERLRMYKDREEKGLLGAAAPVVAGGALAPGAAAAPFAPAAFATPPAAPPAAHHAPAAAAGWSRPPAGGYADGAPPPPKKVRFSGPPAEREPSPPADFGDETLPEHGTLHGGADPSPGKRDESEGSGFASPRARTFGTTFNAFSPGGPGAPRTPRGSGSGSGAKATPAAAAPADTEEQQRERQDRALKKAEKRARRDEKETRRAEKERRRAARAAGGDGGGSASDGDGDEEPAAPAPAAPAEKKDEPPPAEKAPAAKAAPSAARALCPAAPAAAGNGMVKLSAMGFVRRTAAKPAAPAAPEFADGRLREVDVPGRAPVAAPAGSVSTDLTAAKAAAQAAAGKRGSGDSDSESAEATVTIKR